MTFQPPPPPPGGNPPPPPPPPPPSQPPGQWGPPPGGGYPAPRGFDPKNVNPLDWALVGIGFLIFIFSFVDFYSGADITCGGRSVSVGTAGSASAWHEIFGGGFFAWFGMLFGLAGGALIAMDLFAPQVKLPIATRLAALGAFGVAAVFEIIAIFVTPGIDTGGFGGCSASVNHGFGFWISLIMAIGGAVIALMRAQQTGTALPGPLANMPNIGAKGPQGGIGGQGGGSAPPPPPPPPGYGQPPTG
jgi:hypothetical protein